MKNKILSLMLILVLGFVYCLNIQGIKCDFQRGNLKVVQQTMLGSPVSGARFTVYRCFDDGETTDEIDLSKMEQYGLESSNTDSNGETTFSNLPYGRYLLVQSTLPSGVATPAQNVLVDIPTYTVNESGQVVSNENPVIYIKNTVGAGDAIFTFLDESNNALRISGLTFQLYKEGVSVSSTDLVNSDNTNATLNLTTDVRGKIELLNLPVGEYTLVQTASSGGYIFDSTPIEFEVKIENGAVAVDAQLNQTRYKPQFTQSSPQHLRSLSHGDTLVQQIRIDLPLKDVQSASTMAMTRTSSISSTYLNYLQVDLDLPTGVYPVSSDNIDVYLGEDELNDGYSVDGTTVVIEDMSQLPQRDEDSNYISVVYTTNVRATGSNIGTLGNSSTATLQYSKNAYESITQSEVSPSTVYTLTSEEQTWYMYGYRFTKADKSGNVLSGAKFMVSRDGTLTVTDKQIANPITIEGNSIFTSDASGIVQINGLAQGTYYVYEVDPPTYMDDEEEKAYKLLRSPVEITVGETTHLSSMCTITNYKAALFPFTGGQSFLSMSFIGVALVIIGYIIYRTSLYKKFKKYKWN